MKTATYILDFWFGKNPSFETRGKLWFGNDTETDSNIKKEFEETLLAAKKGLLDSWKEKPLDRLALIILYDQFPRNIYRASSKAFSFDELAIQNCLDGIKKGQEKKLLPIQKVFFCMPMQHSEDLEVQKLSLQKFKEIAAEEKILEPTYDYAIKHHDIIEKFGRFPHRNQVLKRESSKEELHYLKTAERFGQ